MTLPGLGELPAAEEQAGLLDVARAEREVVGEVRSPVAHVHVLLRQPHLDKVFDYLVPASMDSSAVVGARVVVDVGAHRASGFIVGRDSTSEAAGRLRPLRRVVSALPVLTPEVYGLCVDAAARCAGSTADLLSLAVPERHARAEKAHLAAHGGDIRADRLAVESYEAAVGSPWRAYLGGPAFLRRVAAGQGPSAVCCELPGSDAVAMLADAASAARASGRGCLVVAPTRREASRIAEGVAAATGESVALVVADEPHESRYAAFLRILTGIDRVVVGTRSAVWAPVGDLGLVAVLDDASPNLREQHAPYVRAGEALAMRAAREGAAFLSLSGCVSLSAQAMIERGEAALVRGEPTALRASLPRVSAAEQWERDGASWSRLPESAFALVRHGLDEGPVLVVVPRAGYIPLTACASCREIARCETCGGSLGLDFGEPGPRCRRCGLSAARWRCPECGGGRIRAVRLGSHRTAEEIGKAFPGTGIVMSGSQASEGIVDSVSGKPRIVVATPGSEPAAQGGYRAALVLDSRFLRGDGPGSEIEFVRRACRIVARVRPAREGGHVMFAGGIDPVFLRMLNTWGQPDFAAGLYAQRRELKLPPSAFWLAVTGESRSVRTYLGVLRSSLFAAEASEAETAERHADAASDAHSRDPLLAGGIIRLASGYELLGPVPSARPRNDARRNEGMRNSSIRNEGVRAEAGNGAAARGGAGQNGVGQNASGRSETGRSSVARTDEVTVYVRCAHALGPSLAAHARAAHREYTAKQLGPSLRLEVDPDV